jgi:hypothetical protein
MAMLEKARLEVPTWLDADFLFRLNYGTATREDVEEAKVAIISSFSNDLRFQRKKRVRITLLDRVVAGNLYRALFPRAPEKPLFAVDGAIDNEKRYAERLSPFDYDENDPSVYPLLWIEEFIVNHIWNDNYSGSVLSSDSRPPMNDVVLDMIALLEFSTVWSMEHDADKPPKVYDMLRGFAATVRMRSSPPGILLDDSQLDWAARGFLADMFNAIICVRYLARVDPKCRKRTEPGEILGWDWMEKGGPRRWPEKCGFPGSDCLRIPKPFNDQDKAARQLGDLNAEFICSGPFKFTFTTFLAEHLTFNQNHEIRLFFDGGFEEFNFPNFPGHVLESFEQHALGRSPLFV